jgi:methylase of polypeptide subunit release factors
MVMVEINEKSGKNVRDLFEREGYQAVNIVKDISGKDRIVKAVKN